MALMAELPAPWNRRWIADGAVWLHDHQMPPRTAQGGGDWTTWLLLGGRGAGKTRAGAEWVKQVALADPYARIALVGETEHDAREVMIEGVSGLLAVHAPRERPAWIPSRRRIEWSNGAVAQAFSAEDPESSARPAVFRRLVRRARQVAACRRRPSTCCSSGCGSARGRGR